MIADFPRGPVVSLIFLLATGCSFIAVRPVPTVQPQSGRTVCANYVPVALDGMALPAWAFLGYFADHFCVGDGAPCTRSATPYIPAMIIAASAVYGLWAVNHCNGKLEQLPPAAAKPFPAPGDLPSRPPR